MSISVVVTRPKSLGSAETRTKALDTPAGLLQCLDAGRVGDAEERREPERRPMRDGNPLLLEQRRGELLVIADTLARLRALADHARAVRIDVERAFGLRAGEALGLIQHGNHEVAPLLEGGDPVLQKALWAFQRLDCCPLADRARVRGRLRLKRRDRLDERLRRAAIADTPAGHRI